MCYNKHMKMTDEQLNKLNSGLTKLLVAYNRVRDIKFSKIEEITLPFLVQNPKLYKHYLNQIVFLEENKIEDWFLFFYALHMSTSWQFVWRINRCCTPKALEIYKSWRSRAMDMIGMQEKSTEAVEKSQWFDIFEFVEESKLRLQKKGRELVCKANKEKFYGYHPKSSVCTSCAIRGDCANEITSDFKFISGTDLDIINIRSGLVTRDHANEVLGTKGNVVKV